MCRTRHTEQGTVRNKIEQVLAFIECWKDQAAIDIHNATEHFTGTFPKLLELCDGEPAVMLFEEL